MEQTDGEERDTTSAGRLHRLLSMLKAAQGPTFYAVLANTLQVDVLGLPAQPPHQKLMNALHDASLMLNDFNRELIEARLHPDALRFHLRAFNDTVEVLSPEKHHKLSWLESRNLITDVLLVQLESADMALRSSVGEQVVPKANLTEVVSALGQVLQLLHTSDLPLKVRDFLIEHTLKVRHALDVYAYRGIHGFEEALAAYVGAVAMTSDEVKTHINAEGQETIASVLVKGKQIIDLAQSFVGFWPTLHSGVTTILHLLP